MKERLPVTRKSVTHKAVIHSAEGRIKFFITVGMYPPDPTSPEGLRGARDRPGELFLTFDEAGSGLDGWADAWSTALSICLQHGESLTSLIDKFGRQRFAPQGMTENPEIPVALSVPDYVMRWMEREFVKPDDGRQTTDTGPERKEINEGH